MKGFLVLALTLLATVTASHQSRIRQYYHDECEELVNRQVNIEMQASYTYQAMASYYNRDDVALPGFHKMFEKASAEERTHADLFTKYQNKRGGSTVYEDITAPLAQSWTTPLEAVLQALELEKQVNDNLIQLHRSADKHHDNHLMDFIENEFLTEQVDAIKELGDLATRLERAGRGLGEIIVDKELQ